MKYIFILIFLPSICFAQLANWQPSGNTTSTALWHFNEGTGSTGYDNSGNGRRLTYSGTVNVDPCLFGACRDYNGTSDYSATFAQIPILTTYTMSSWIKIAPVSTPRLIFGWGNNNIGTGGTQDHALSLTDTGVLTYYVYVAAERCITDSVTQVDDDKWHHVAVSCASGVFKLYVDGLLKKTDTYANCGYTGYDYLYFNIGKNQGSACSGSYSVLYFDGLIEDTQISNTVKTEGEIRHLYSGQYGATQ